MSFVMVRIPEELRDRIDAERPSTVSRESYVRQLLAAGLDSGVLTSYRDAPVDSHPEAPSHGVGDEHAPDRYELAQERARKIYEGKAEK